MTATDLYRIRAILVHALEAIEMTINSPLPRGVNAEVGEASDALDRALSLLTSIECDAGSNVRDIDAMRLGRPH